MLSLEQQQQQTKKKNSFYFGVNECCKHQRPETKWMVAKQTTILHIPVIWGYGVYFYFFFVCTPVCEQTVAHQHERYSAADMNADAERRHFCRIIYKIKNSTNCDHEEFSLIRQVGRPDCDIRLTHSTGIGRVRCRYKYKCAWRLYNVCRSFWAQRFSS